MREKGTGGEIEKGTGRGRERKPAWHRGINHLILFKQAFYELSTSISVKFFHFYLFSYCFLDSTS